MTDAQLMAILTAILLSRKGLGLLPGDVAVAAETALEIMKETFERNQRRYDA